MVSAQRQAARYLMLVAVAAGGASLARAEPDAAGQGQPPALLLLKNGSVLSGQVTLVGEYYRLVNEGSELRLRTTEVAHIASSRGELYTWRRSLLQNPTLDDHLTLAEWCAREGLFAEAARELLDARTRDARSPRVAYAERRLQHAWRSAQAPQIAERSQRLDTQIADQKMAESARSAERLRLMQTLPEGALEHFTRRVQPILVNNCTTSGCHQTGSDASFQLSRSILHGRGDRRSTFTNLAAVLSAIDREHVEASPLLRAAGGPHAGAPLGLLTGRQQGLLDEVAEWARLVSDPAAAAVTEPAAPTRANHAAGFASMVGGGFRQPPPPYQSLPAPATPSAPSAGFDSPTAEQPADYDVAAATYEAPMPGNHVPSSDARDVVRSADYEQSYEPLPPGRTLRGLKNAQAAPRDEFDPEVFNRQYRQASRGR